MVRKLASDLSKLGLLESLSSSARRSSGNKKRQTVSATRYHLAEGTFVNWPRTAVFLLECRKFKRDENGNVSREGFADHLRTSYGFTDEAFEEDWGYLLERNYINSYPSGFSAAIRIEAELQWLQLLAREHQTPTQRQ